MGKVVECTDDDMVWFAEQSKKLDTIDIYESNFVKGSNNSRLTKGPHFLVDNNYYYLSFFVMVYLFSLLFMGVIAFEYPDALTILGADINTWEDVVDLEDIAAWINTAFDWVWI